MIVLPAFISFSQILNYLLQGFWAIDFREADGVSASSLPGPRWSWVRHRGHPSWRWTSWYVFASVLRWLLSAENWVVVASSAVGLARLSEHFWCTKGLQKALGKWNKTCLFWCKTFLQSMHVKSAQKSCETVCYQKLHMDFMCNRLPSAWQTQAVPSRQCRQAKSPFIPLAPLR